MCISFNLCPFLSLSLSLSLSLFSTFPLFPVFHLLSLPYIFTPHILPSILYSSYPSLPFPFRSLPSFLSLFSQDFELEVAGAHIVKVTICSKQLLKEECYAHGKIRVGPAHAYWYVTYMKNHLYTKHCK